MYKRQILVPSRPNIRSREEITEIDRKLLHHAEQICTEKQHPEESMSDPESEGKKHIFRGESNVALHYRQGKEVRVGGVDNSTKNESCMT